MLPDLPRGFTSYPVDFGISLDAFERQIAAEAFEVGAAFSLDGSLILRPRRGRTDEVDFAPSEAPHLKNAIVSHNHPTGFPFSDSDGELAALRDVTRLRAVCPSGVCFEIERPDRGWPSPARMMEAALSALVGIREEASRRQAERLREATDEQNIRVAVRAQRKAFAEIGVNLTVTDVWERG